MLSAEDAKALYETTGEERREMEVVGGSFELGDWPEFAKRFGHLLLRNFARMRLAALVEAVSEIRIGPLRARLISTSWHCMNITSSRLSPERWLSWRGGKRRLRFVPPVATASGKLRRFVQGKQ
jgi:hypothetical protein